MAYFYQQLQCYLATVDKDGNGYNLKNLAEAFQVVPARLQKPILWPCFVFSLQIKAITSFRYSMIMLYMG